MRGYFGIGIYQGKTPVNIGTLWRSAFAFGADFIFTVGPRYKAQASDTTKAPKHVPLFSYETFADMKAHLPWSCPLVGVEIDERAISLAEFKHPERACYLLGAEDYGLPQHVLRECHKTIVIPGASRCLNVAVAGSIVLYDRITRRASASEAA